MSEKGLKPKIRFTGFTEDWEQHELGDISDIRTGPFGSSLHADDYVDDGTPIITTEHFKSSELPEKKSGIPQVSETDFRRLQNYVLNTDDIVFSRVGSVDINALITQFQSGWLFSGRVLRVRTNDSIESQYLHYELSTERVKNDVIGRAVGQTMPSINTEILKKTKVYLPTKIVEQRKIGTIFRSLDNLITLHQRKCDKLINFKKAMLEKMFPKDGADVPEIRFAGFTGAWERHKLGDLSETFEYGLNAASIAFDGVNKYIRITDIDDETRLFKTDNLTSPDIDLSKAEKYKLENGDILFARTGASVGKTYIYRDIDGLTYYAGFLIRARIKPEVNAEFIFQNTLTKGYDKFIKVTSQRSGQPGVNAQEYSDFIVRIPQFAEQNKIATFFKNLDSLITLHQRELEKLKNIKKAMLDKMFV